MPPSAELVGDKGYHSDDCAPGWRGVEPRLSSRSSSSSSSSSRSSSTAMPRSKRSATSSSACSAASRTGARSQPNTTEISTPSWQLSPSPLPSSGGSNESGPEGDDGCSGGFSNICDDVAERIVALPTLHHFCGFFCAQSPKWYLFACF